MFVLAASNAMGFDGAMLRRLEKRILVGLHRRLRESIYFNNFDDNTSGGQGKHAQQQVTLPCTSMSNNAAKTEGHSGADIDVVCRGHDAPIDSSSRS